MARPEARFRVQLTLDEVSYFQHSASCTIWLGSSSCPQLMDLQAGLQAAFPEFDELTLDPERNIRGFRPHLSLGQWTPQQVEQSLQVDPSLHILSQVF